jgi:transcription-repair coupling factor (superfamily II helicase)
MTIEELKSVYRHSEKVDSLCHKLSTPGKIHLSGLAGSAISFIADACQDKIKGTHLFIVPDKEQAAYLLNDLENVMGKDKCLFFPASFRKPYEPEAVENANILYRAEALNTISRKRGSLAIVTYAQALTEKVVTRKHLRQNTFTINRNEKLSLDFLTAFLYEYEFERVDFVMQPGEFSIRGGIIDVFSFAGDYPYRIELLDDEVESIRTFDISTQLSVAKFDRVNIIPNINNKLLKESREDFLSYLPDETVLWTANLTATLSLIDKYFQQATELYQQHKDALFEPLPPDEHFTSAQVFEEALNKRVQVEFETASSFSYNETIHFNFHPQPSFNKNFDLLIDALRSHIKYGLRNLLFTDTPKQAERIFTILTDITALKGKPFSHDEVNPIAFSLHQGFIDEDHKVACLTDHQIFDRYHKYKLKDISQRKSEAITLKDLQSLSPGDFVTHIDHGIGKFAGLETIEVNGKLQESIRLVYRDNDILYVSINSLHRIAKFSGQEGTMPKLNKLGTNAWNILKERTKKKVKEIAYDLIKLYAKRKMSKGFEFSPDTYLQTELEASFIYEDTPDQIKSVAAIKKDMEAPYPMDRLVCGDVGFGKTEVAVRAAFKAVNDSKQVAVLVPTTILALQHFKTFSERLKEFPCTVDYINRFKSAKEQKETLQKLKEGKIDILIGTHRLIAKDVVFKNLGLLIIDEEQKFGVAAKDKLKTLKANIDTLTLTATPIPRTLQFSMMGARDLSVITTPPPNRYPVQTEVHVFNEELVRDAVAFEIARGGQVFFVHNRVQSIMDVSGMIQRLCPDARVVTAHGQMDGEKLEETLLSFINGDYDVLVATTIIESGLDIPNANTIIIHQAHLFGLSDLHQMRGRVGRSNKKAFCYLLAPPASTLTPEARKRLRAIEEFAGLGSGFNIALRDLDIRGAGNLLGGEQSGFISEIGFDMYMKILNEAIQELKETEFKDIYESDVYTSKRRSFGGSHGSTYVNDCIIDTDLELLIPSSYVNNITERLSLYRELDEITTETELEIFAGNLVDRFGPIPEETIGLMTALRLRWIAIQAGFEKVVLKSNKMIGYFITKPDSPYYESAQFNSILTYIKENPRQVRMKQTSQNKLTLVFDECHGINAALARMKMLLQKAEAV